MHKTSGFKKQYGGWVTGSGGPAESSLEAIAIVLIRRGKSQM